MRHILIAFLATFALVSLDLKMRGNLITDNLIAYCAVATLLFGLIYFLRLTLTIPKTRFVYIPAILLTAVFSIIYWIQSSVYTVYFQFITAVDIGLVVENLNYWKHGAKKLISIINLQWLIGYLFIFSFAFCYRLTPVNKTDQNSFKTVTLIALILATSSLSSLFYIKKQQLHFLTTPVMSLTHEVRRFNLQRPRFMKQLKPGVDEEFYARDIDPIPEFERRSDFNVLFIILESLRPDHMSLYGYERDTTPFQKQRFKNAFTFPHAVSNTTSTDTSAELIFTGKDRTNSDIHSTSAIWSYLKQAELNLFYSGSHWLEWNGRFGRAFLSHDVDSIQAPLAVDASLTGYDWNTARKVKRTLAQFADKKDPFFGVVHFAGTHYPYVSPSDYHQWTPIAKAFEPKQVQKLINKYDNSILYNDAAVEQVVTELDKLNLRDNTIIIVTADHGEAMYEHQQFFHGKVFWQEGIHVPLYIDIPDRLKSTFSQNELDSLISNADKFVSIVDLFPTILDIYNIPAGKKLDGHSLLKPYPESFIKIYMIPEEFAVINSHSGEKYHLDNAKKELRYTKLFDDPNEKNSAKLRTEQSYSIHEIIELAKSKQLHKNFNLN